MRDEGERSGILVVEDEPIIAEDLSDLCTRAGHRVVGTAHSSERALLLARRMRPALALVDVNLGEATDGIDLAETLVGGLGVPVIFITSYMDRRTLERAGAVAPLGYIVKPFQEAQVRSSVEVALAQVGRFVSLDFDPQALSRPGQEPMSPAEIRVLECVWGGMGTQQMAETLHVSTNTIKFHLKRIHAKLGVRTRGELVRALQERARR